MAGSWTTDRFAIFAEALHELVERHRKIEHQPLHLALAYRPAVRDPQDVFLVEMLGGTGLGPNPERDLFEVTFPAPAGFPMNPDEHLHLILTTPGELEVALRDRWPLAEEISAAVRDGDYQVLHADETGRQELGRLRSTVCRPEPAHG